MADTHEGGCLCGAVRYRVNNAPIVAAACHCTYCQRRTGSAFGLVSYFREQDVEIMRGVLKTYEHRSDESKRWIRMQFCVTCGTTVTLRAEVLPDARGIAGGTFDDPKWLKIEWHTWLRSAHPWVLPPLGVEKFQENAIQKPKKIN
jgi:hypothetical protein